MKELDVNEFLSFKNNEIKIFFNTTFFPSKTEDQAVPFLGYWLFFKNRESVPISSETLLMWKGKKFEITKIDSIIKKTHGKWKMLYPDIDFPDICIWSGKQGSSSLASASGKTKKYFRINIKAEDLEDPIAFEFILKHELGHLLYLTRYKIEQERELKKHQVKVFEPLRVKRTITMTILISSVCWIHKEEAPALAATFLSFLFLLGTYLILNKISFQTRLKNFNSEFFSDFFAYSWMNSKASDLPELVFGTIRENHFSHPSFVLRKLNLHRNSHKKMNEWKSPIVTHLKLFKKGSAYDIYFFLEKTYKTYFP